QLLASYHQNCINGAAVLDHFSTSSPLGYYHYTLYYYDRAGNLIKTVPPKGVDDTKTNRGQHPAHTFVTEYAPNSLKQIVRQKTPDGGETKFWYDNKSRLRFSQNAKQLADTDYSYTKYDNLGRITEVGVLNNLDTLQVSSQSYPVTGNERERTITVYSAAAAGINYFNNKPQRYLQNRVSYSYTDVDGNLATTTDKVSTYFSYDPHGNVEWVIQEQPELGKSYIAYSYDVISGSVLQVSYNENLIDRFFHRYTYDTDKRIKTAQTSKDGLTWDTDASYKYYAHGPLKRTVIGEDSVQGTDYVYTIQGWLKGMNHSSLDVDNDPAHDGKVSTAHAYTAKDIYGMVLGYYSGDFNRSSSPFNTTLAGTDLFNGNISSWTNNIGHVTGSLKREQLTGNKYRYDELNRLTSADFWYYQSAVWNDTTTYDEAFAYDANGNITNLLRKGYKNGSTVDMDSLTYKYESGNNQLNWAKDAVTSSPYTDDIEGQSANNYTYDSIGNLIADVDEGIDTISWNVYGKIKYIVKSNGDRIQFLYNAAGQRVRKEVIPNASPDLVTSTYYTNDASGNAMSIYERTSSGTSPAFTATLKMVEQPIYGSDRIGERMETDLTVATLTYTDIAPPVAGSLAIVHMDTLSSAYLPVQRSTKIVKKSPFVSYSLQSNYAGVKQLGTDGTAAVNDNILLSATNVTQGRYAAKVKDDCGKVLLSANSITLQGYINRANPAVKQVCYVYDGNNHLLINGSGIKAGNQSQMAFIKVPGTEQQYYLFTIGADKLPYVHTIDIAQRKVISKNALLDNTVGYGYTMKVLEDLVGTGNSQLYLRRIKSTKDSAYVMSFEITSGGIGSGKILARFVSKDINGVGEIDLNPDATKMLVANTKGGPAIWWWHTSSKIGELKLFTLNAGHNAITATSSVSLGSYSSARSVAFNADGTNIYYNRYYNGVNSLRKYSSTFTSPYQVVASQASGDIRRGNNDKLFSPKPGDKYIYTVTDGTSPTYTANALGASSGTMYTGGVQMNKHIISHGLNCMSNGFYTRNMLHKSYELKDHLSNVRVVITDLKAWDDDGDDIPEGGEYTADVSAYNNYYAFGSPQPGRTFNPTAYRYNFNGKESDPEVIGTAGGTVDYGMRIYNPSLGRFLSVDPLTKKYPELTPYQFASNTPIWAIDLDGLEARIYTETQGSGHTFISVGKDDDIVVYTYGRYAGTTPEWHGINALSNGPGVLVKLTGKDAQRYIREKLNIDDAKAFEITDVNEKDVADFFEKALNSSNESPDKGQFKDKDNARVVDEYKLFSNNCTTKSCEALKEAGTGAVKDKIVIPAALQLELGEKSIDPKSPVKNVTEATKKEINSSTTGGSGGTY
ncbi:MAG: RHS repeat-associated core domain-containing protein, partial [Bacteroidota bacterium]